MAGLVPLFRGLNDRDPPPLLPPGWLRVAQNILAVSERSASAFKARPGLSRYWVPVTDSNVKTGSCLGLYSWLLSGTVNTLFATSGGQALSADRGIYHYDGSSNTRLLLPNNDDDAGLPQSCRANLHTFAAWRDQVYIANGNENKRFQTGTSLLYPMGTSAPSVAPALAEGAAGALDGTYSYVYTYVDPTLGRRSNPSSATSITVASKKVTVTPTVCSDTTYTHWDLYRTKDGGVRYLKIGRYARLSGAVTDNTLDTALDETSEVGDEGDNISDMGPNCKVVARLSDGRIALMNDVDNDRPRRIYVSYDSDHPEEFPEANQVTCGPEQGGEIVAAVPFGDYTAVILSDGVFVLNRDNTSADERVQRIGGAGRHCACSTPYGVVYVNTNGVYLFTGYRAEKLSGVIDGTWGTVDADWLPYACCEYSPDLDHVLVGVCTIDGDERNNRTLALDCRTLSRRNEYGERAPRWSVWTVKAEAFAVCETLSPGNSRTFVGTGLGVVMELDPSVNSDGVNTDAGTRWVYGGTLYDPSNAGTNAVAGMSLVPTMGDSLHQIFEATGVTGGVMSVVQETGEDALSLAVDDTYQCGAIYVKVITGELDFGEPAHDKKFHEMWLFTEQP
jgi:hypothetical protein